MRSVHPAFRIDLCVGIGEFSGLVCIGAENLNSNEVRVRLMDGFEHAGKFRRGLSQGDVPPASEIELVDYLNMFSSQERIIT